MSRRNGRVIAFQAVYSWDVTKASLDDLLSFEWLQKDVEVDGSIDPAEQPVVELSETSKEERTFASLIIAGTISHIDEIDKLIESHLSASWSMERISRVALAILRTSVYELLFQNGAEPKIVIDEAVNIAKDFDTDDSYKFINAVLDKIGKDEPKRA
ncbi:NusB antitermination factor [Treponema bryantii]|uniref:Transcription antitermination protein NusB n=1 Tax=Treponema bryantii TaxID=163 RepID=A0A1H9HRL4_9SPIR|nr:transcription antitermination factor NusB [Treponema bryantii]BDC94377.1 N utilization substance protein B [Treponema bryantii]SEQ64872.1 NusB antitermination factor [Treponema bryantii]